MYLLSVALLVALFSTMKCRGESGLAVGLTDSHCHCISEQWCCNEVRRAFDIEVTCKLVQDVEYNHILHRARAKRTSALQLPVPKWGYYECGCEYENG